MLRRRDCIYYFIMNLNLIVMTTVTILILMPKIDYYITNLCAMQNVELLKGVNTLRIGNTFSISKRFCIGKPLILVVSRA